MTYTIEVTYSEADSLNPPVKTSDCIGFSFETIEEGTELLKIMKEHHEFYLTQNGYGRNPSKVKNDFERYSEKEWFCSKHPQYYIIFKGTEISIGMYIGYFEQPISAKIIKSPEEHSKDTLTEIYF